MAENQAVKSNRESYLERLRAKHPEKKFEDDEEIFGQISEDYDQNEKELEGHRATQESLEKMFAADPRSAQFLTDMYKGRSPWASYIRLFGPELKDSLDDPEVIEQIAEAEKEYVQRIAESKKLDEEYEKNLAQSVDTLNQFQESHGLTDDQTSDVIAALIGIVRDGVMGKFTPDTLEMIVKAINHDQDVATAGEEGEIAGRNARITERLKSRSKGDGTIVLAGKNGRGGQIQDKPKTVFDLAKEAR